MSIFQFFRIIWARRFIISGAALAGLVVAMLIILIVPPKYEADSRVMLDIIKPDPITGQVISSVFLRAYTKTQIQLIEDFKVASQVVDDLGWQENPKMLAKYRDRKKSDDRDFTHWAADLVSSGTDASLIEGSNILEIRYTAEDPTTAKVVADAIRKAYADTTLQARREDARRNADWYDVQAAKTKAVLLAAEQKKSDYERQTGIILQDNNMDVDSARLAALAGQGGGAMTTPMMGGGGSTGAASLQLAQLDADIADASKTLGPNHPKLVAMRQKRGLLAVQAAKERDTLGQAAAASASAARAAQGMLAEQKSRVIAQREQVEHLRLLQDDVNLRRDQYTKAVTRSAQLRQEADVADPGLTPLGNAVTPLNPVFPNKPLVFGGAIGAGLAIGTIAALLLEILGRRVRSMEDLRSAVGVPVLTVINDPDVKPRPTENFLRTLLRRSRRVQPSAARA